MTGSASRGGFAITLEKIGCINRAGIRSVIMTTVSGTNIDEVPDIVDAVVQAGANVFAFARYCPTSEEKDVGIEPLRYRKLLEDCDRKFRAYEAAGCETYFNKKDHLWTLYAYETGAFRLPEDAQPGMIYGGCNCGNCHLTILPTGEVYACRRVQNSRVGNVFADRLADLWIGPMEAYATTTGSPSAQSANCWPTAGDVRRWPAGGTGTFTRRTRSAGRR